MDNERYGCGRCANRRSPLCDMCTSVTAPDGTVSKPKYFVMLDEVIPLNKQRTLEGRGKACAELLELYLRNGSPLPVGIVMEYNGHVEKKRES